MNYTEVEVNALAHNALSPSQLERATRAFNGIADLFDRVWIEKFLNNSFGRPHVMHLTSLWENWLDVRDLQGADELHRKWSLGAYREGVEAELFVIANLRRWGAKVELFPPVNNRVADCRFRLDSDWVYGEVSQRGISKVRSDARVILGRVATAASAVISGKHGYVAIFRVPDSSELERITSWLENIKDDEETRLDDLALFFTDSIDSSVHDEGRLAELVPEPRYFNTYLKMDPAAPAKGTACMGVSDENAGKVLRDEAAQLPKDGPGVVFLDVSGIIGGVKEWSPLIQRRFQPNINTRISAVALYETGLTVAGPKYEGQILVNPFAKNALIQSLIYPLQSAIT